MSYTFWLEVSIWHSPQSLLDRWDRPGHRSCPGRWDRPGHRFFDPLICPPPPPPPKRGLYEEWVRAGPWARSQIDTSTFG